MGFPAKTASSSSSSANGRSNGADMSQRRHNTNIYHGMLTPESSDNSQMPLPLEYSTGADYSMAAPQMLASRQGTYPPASNLGMMPHNDILGQYQQHDYQSHSSRGINMPPHQQNYGAPNYSSQFSADLDQRYSLSPDHVPDSYTRADTAMPYAFPGPAQPRPPMTSSSRGYSDPFSGDVSEHQFDSDMQSGQALPDPGEYLRIKLGLQPGEPVNLWSLPDPEPGQRPPHSYPLLVRLAIHGSPNQRMTLKQIYAAIEERFEYYRNQPKGAWKGSIRHNLSLNQVFRNVHRPLTEPGKGNYWEIDHSKGEGYKRDRKRKSRRGRGAGGRDDDGDEDDNIDSGNELDMGMFDSDYSDASQGSASGSQSSLHRSSSSRASRRASPYSMSRPLDAGSPHSRRSNLPMHAGPSRGMDHGLAYLGGEAPPSPAGSIGYGSGSSMMAPT